MARAAMKVATPGRTATRGADAAPVTNAPAALSVMLVEVNAVAKAEFTPVLVCLVKLWGGLPQKNRHWASLRVKMHCSWT